MAKTIRVDVLGDYSEHGPFELPADIEVDFDGKKVPLYSMQPDQIFKGYHRGEFFRARVVAPPVDPPKPVGVTLLIRVEGEDLVPGVLCAHIRERLLNSSVGVSKVGTKVTEVLFPEDPEEVRRQMVRDLLARTEGHRLLGDPEHPLTMAHATMRHWLERPKQVLEVSYNYALAILTRIQW